MLKRKLLNRVAWTLNLLGTLALAGCGQILDPDAAQGPPLTTLKGTLSGALELPDSNVRAALVWSTYNDALLGCLAEIPSFEPPLDRQDDADWAIIKDLYTCEALHSDSDIETSSVALQAGVSNIELPILDAPEADLLSGSEGAWMGVASMTVYLDGNTTGNLELAPPGTTTWPDQVLGTSGRTLSRTTASYALYREGEVSPLWKLFEGMYGCTDIPPVGFSTLHTEVVEDDNGFLIQAGCTIETQPLDILLEDSLSVKRRICQKDDSLDDYVSPDTVSSFDLGWDYSCHDSGNRLYYSSDASILCPVMGRVDLAGCTDRASLQTCQATAWNYLESPPAWWPCGDLWVHGFGSSEGASADLDLVARFEMRSGFINPETVRLEADLPGGGTSDAFSIEWNDLNNDGYPNEGDELNVYETEHLFDEGSAIGGYEIRLFDSSGLDPGPVATALFFPRNVDVMPFEIGITDATPSETAASGASFFIDVLSGDGSYDPATLSVDVAWSCEPSVTIEPPNVVHLDQDGDEQVTAGDRIEVRAVNDDIWKFPSGYDCVDLYAVLGPNLRAHIGSSLWIPMSDFMYIPVADPYTEELDPLFDITVGYVGELVFLEALDNQVRFKLERNDIFLQSLPGTMTYADINGDGLVNEGDTIRVFEGEDFFGPDTPATDVTIYLTLGGVSVPYYSTELP